MGMAASPARTLLQRSPGHKKYSNKETEGSGINPPPSVGWSLLA